MQSCSGWRETADCDPEGRREHSMDQPCSQIILSTSSGFCECERGRIVHMVKCSEHMPTTCEEECMRPIQQQQNVRAHDDKRLAVEDKLRRGERVLGCAAWRGVIACDPNGKRSLVNDHRCDSKVSGGVAGFCECQHGAVAAKYGCSDNPGGFTCADKCAELGDPAEVRRRSLWGRGRRREKSALLLHVYKRF